MTRKEAIQSALDAYWTANNHAEVHASMQRLAALNQTKYLGDAFSPCPEPECVALRAATLASIEEGENIIDITRDMARAP